MGPEDAKETRPNLLFTWALSGGVEGKSSELGPDFFYQCCVVLNIYTSTTKISIVKDEVYVLFE